MPDLLDSIVSLTLTPALVCTMFVLISSYFELRLLLADVSRDILGAELQKKNKNGDVSAFYYILQNFSPLSRIALLPVIKKKKKGKEKRMSYGHKWCSFLNQHR